MAAWIGKKERSFRGPASVFRKVFCVSEEVSEAKVKICGVGQYEWTVNGERVDDYELEPAWTNYRKSVYYRLHEISGNLHPGENVIEIMVGNGMYNVEGGRYTKFTGSMGEPAAWMELEITYVSGKKEKLATDEEWMVSESAVTFSCVYGGEDVNALWTPAWEKAVIVKGPAGEMLESPIPPVKVLRTWPGVRVPELENGSDQVFDVRQNMSGFFRITARGTSGTRIRVWLYEMIRQGRLTQEDSGTPHYYEYTFAGKGTEVFRPHFTYYGFRHIRIEVLEGNCEIEGAEGLQIYPDAEPAGDIETSNELLNRIHHIVKMAILNNTKTVFTDCPHREKLGWLEEVHLMGPSLLYNFHYESLMEKVIRDMEEAQLENGLVPDIAPEFVEFENGFRDSAEWGSACILVPWYLYRFTGKTEILEKAFPMMTRYAKHLKSRTKYHLLHHGLGDWYDFGVYNGYPQNTPVPPVASAFYYMDLLLLDKICGILGRDASEYRREAEMVRTAYNREFFDSDNLRYSTGSQTANTLPLFLGLVPKGKEQKILERILEDLELRDHHLTGGDVGFPFMMRLLDRCGCNDELARIFLKEDEPSYGFQVRNGATALCEAWSGNHPDHPVNSQDHLMLGSIEEWFFHGLAGFKRCHECAYDEIRISPYYMKELEFMKAWHDYPAGRVALEWTRKKGCVSIDVTVPKEAIFTLPDGTEKKLTAGTAHFEAEAD